MRECDLVFRAYLLSDDNFTIASLPIHDTIRSRLSIFRHVDHFIHIPSYTLRFEILRVRNVKVTV